MFLDTFNSVTRRIIESIEALGIKICLQQHWPGHFEHFTPPEFKVGVIAGFRPHEAVFYSIIYRIHPEEIDADYQLFQFHIMSQHRPQVDLIDLFREPFLPTRIRDDRDIKRRIGYGLIPGRRYDIHNDGVHQVKQFLSDSFAPLEEKALYAQDLFTMFLNRCRDTFMERFSFGVEPYVVPDHSNAYEDVKHPKGMLHGRFIDKHFWYQALDEFFEKGYMQDPAFPFPSSDVLI